MYQTCVKIIIVFDAICQCLMLPTCEHHNCSACVSAECFQLKSGESQKAPPGGAPWKEVPPDCLAFHFLYPRMLKATMAANSTNPNTTASPIAPALDAAALFDPEAAQTKP